MVCQIGLGESGGVLGHCINKSPQRTFILTFCKLKSATLHRETSLRLVLSLPGGRGC